MKYVTGDKELLKKFANVQRRVQTKAIDKANSKAIRPVVTAAKRGARASSNTIAKGIGMRKKRYQKGAIQVAVAGVRNLDSVAKERPHINFATKRVGTRKHDPRFTAHLVEKGTKAHTILIPRFKMVIRHPGTKAKPFIEPAFESNVSTMTRIHAEVLGAEIVRACT